MNEFLTSICTARTACCWWATCASIKQSKRGSPYQQLQEAGMQTARLDEIVRQQDPALEEAVEQLGAR